VIAALVTGAGRLELLEVPEPSAGPGQAVVTIAGCGVCGTDVHAYRSGSAYTPAICGHEWAGTVTEVGRATTAVAEGDRVAVGVPPACGECRACRRGQGETCEHVFATAIGVAPGAPVHGGFARAIAVDARRLVPIPDAVTFHDAPLVEPAAVAVHAVRRGGDVEGSVVAVVGAGPIGVLVARAAAAMGAAYVVVIDPSAARRERAAALCGGAVLAPGPAAAEHILARTDGLGADVVYECAGVAETVQAAVDLARRGGRMVLAGVAETAATIVPALWVVKEVTVIGALAYTREDFRLLDGLLVSGAMALGGLRDRTVSLGELAAAFAELAGGKADGLKVVLDPTLEY
jgi:(R,R)-butanediol dehydrogenase/meso-butanediol dehydrogenase/diacetyl reductase